MNREVKVTNGGSLTLAWSLTIEQMYELNDWCVDNLGVPMVTDDRGPVDLTPYIERRMGEVGPSRKEITVTPLEEPSEAPAEPIAVPPIQVPVPVPA